MEARIERLERQVRSWRVIALFAVVVAVGAAVISLRAPAVREVRAHRFVLVGAEGRGEAELGFNDRGEPRLVMELKANEGTVTVGALAEDIGGLAVMGKNANAMLTTDSGGSPSVSLRAGEKRTASLGVGRDGSPVLLLIAGQPDRTTQPNLAATVTGLRIRQANGDVVFVPPREGEATERP